MVLPRVRSGAPRPSPFKWITDKDLRPDDVLLSCGQDPISMVIRKLAGGSYSHAAVWNGTEVVEATDKGVVGRSLTHDVKKQWYNDAYRWQPQPANGHVFGDATYPYQPVTTQVDALAGAGIKFAYDELLLAAVVIAASKAPRNPLLKIAARLVAAEVAAWIHKNITSGGKRSMMCTEVVSTSFWKAIPNPQYAIKIWIGSARSNLLARARAAAAYKGTAQLAAQRAVAATTRQRVIVRQVPSDYEDLQQECAAFVWKAAQGRSWRPSVVLVPPPPRPGASGRILVSVGTPGVPLAFVTPRDFEKSPSLEFVGRLSEQATPVMPSTALGLLVSSLGMP